MLDLEDRWGRTPLLLAASNGNTEVEHLSCNKLHLSKAVSLLLKKGASIQMTNRQRESCLHFAAR